MTEYFILYNGNDFSNRIPKISIENIKNNSNLVARIENSGSEEYYIEIAIWNEKVLKYQRYAFKKFDTLDQAEKVYFNLNIQNNYNHPIIHNMEDYTY